MLMKQSRPENGEYSGEIGEEVNVPVLLEVFEVMMGPPTQEAR